jgi:peptide/nickel transport system permease protein
MAVQEVGSIGAVEDWEAPADHAFLARMFSGVRHFARKKPLGFICGVVVLFFFLIGDAIPETVNKITRTAGVSDRPIPYLADQVVGQVSWLYPYQQQDLRARLEGSSSRHFLGTDAIGRDILSRLFYGARVAVMVAFGATFIAVTIGGTIGIMSGFYMGFVDKVLYRIVDAFQALPGLVLFIVILGIFGSGLWPIVFVLGAVFGPSQSRIIRGQTLSIMSTPFIEAAKVVGASDRRIMTRYVLPNTFHLIVLNATFLLGLMVLVEATLSFLGYGLPPPFPSWGQMLSLDGRQYMRTQPGLAIYPGVAIGILVFSFNLFGDALRDVLDPRLRGSR